MENFQNRKQVSFEDEKLILVNEHDEVQGFKDKAECHSGEGILHRAFSIFLFNSQGQVLMQKRSDQKSLWPLYWSNSCCSHPRKGERIETSSLRRLREELGIDADLKFIFKFQYQAAYQDVGSENELCSVFIGKTDNTVRVNHNEIADWKFMNVDELENALIQNPESFTPWFKIEWGRIRDEHWQKVEKLIAAETQ